MKEKKIINLVPGEWYLARNQKTTFVILITEDPEKYQVPYLKSTRNVKNLTIEKKSEIKRDYRGMENIKILRLLYHLESVRNKHGIILSDKK